MTFQDDLAADMGILLEPTEFGEPITYLPAAGGSLALNAVVKRQPLQATDHGGRQLPTKTVELLIANHATLGVTTVKPRFDKVQLKLNLDDAAETTFVVTKILSQVHGAWRLEAIG